MNPCAFNHVLWFPVWCSPLIHTHFQSNGLTPCTPFCCKWHCLHTLWLTCYYMYCFLYHITLLSFPVCMIIHLLPYSCACVTWLPTTHYLLVPLLYCSVVTHVHIFPYILILIILVHSYNAYRYIVDHDLNG